MKTTLFDLPKPAMPKIEAFKIKHGIATHYAPQCEMPWVALHLRSAEIKFGENYANIDKWYANYGRLLDEIGMTGYGKTEADAIIEACKSVGVTVLPNDL